ncbi:putative pentatricopeptide repeat-containing protein At3g47840 [Hibiscus syriacus]|uniref:putative pentatricopeptide repeat-containing protein At3g47840 n=1 Tax=Hibiscus syriacus TaxID=106335 RepID=UPI0019227A26|nr:putative pentatricopeptide repeat-containing protein At3g47840 [Hibiscus syriacus]
MKKDKVRPNGNCLVTTLKACSLSSELFYGTLLHGKGVKFGLLFDVFVGSSLVDLYAKCGEIELAERVFVYMDKRNVVSWNALLNGYALKDSRSSRVVLPNETQRGKNQHTFASIASVAANSGDQFYCEGIHACILKYGFESEIVLSNALIAMYMKIRSVQNGWHVFKEMSSWDLASWNALLSGSYSDKTCYQGPSIFHKMLAEGFKPDIYTFTNILKSCSHLLNLNFGQQVHVHIIKNGLDDNNSVGTSLIDLYVKNGFLADADLLFSQLIERDLLSWTTLISGYAQSDHSEMAIEYFNQMQGQGVKPNEFTLATCLSNCSKMAMLENGQSLHSMALRAGSFDDVFVSSAIVDMYANCGCIEEAEAAFQGMVSTDVSWNTMLFGYLQHGQGSKVLETFKIMLDNGLKPVEVTFIAVLSACSHMGLVGEGKEHFDSLTNIYRMAPTIKHHACMIDILSRAGKFNEVESFINVMKVTSDPLIWETILGASARHGNEKLGESAAEKLLELDPGTASHYILLSNLFAAKGRWEDVRQVGALMTHCGVKKEAECVFRCGDGFHPRHEGIYVKQASCYVQSLDCYLYMPHIFYSLE